MKIEDLRSFEERVEEINKEMVEGLKQVNEELLTVKKEGLPDWDKWFKRGKPVICGVQLTHFLSLYREQSEKCVRKFAAELKLLGSHSHNLSDLKDGVRRVLDGLVEDQKAIGGPIREWSAYFLHGLGILTAKAILIVIEERLPIKAESYIDEPIIDEETGNRLEATIVNLNAESEMLETIDEHLFRESLKDNERYVWDLMKDEFSEKAIEDKTGIHKSTVHRLITRLRGRYEGWSKG